MAEKIVREWIVSILEERLDVLRVAIRQRAKFEGWLKFELAAHMERQGVEDVKVELPLLEKGAGHSRSDISFSLDGTHYDVELKTSNTSWRVSGTPYIRRSTTANLAAIIKDGEKLRGGKGRGVIAFIFFPVRSNDNIWERHLKRIVDALSLSPSVQEYTSRVHVLHESGHTVDVVVCCFDIPKTALGSYEVTDSRATNVETQEQFILRFQ